MPYSWCSIVTVDILSYGKHLERVVIWMRNVPNGLRCFNTWNTAGGAVCVEVMESLGGGALMEEVLGPGGWNLRVHCFVLAFENVRSQLPLAVTMLCHWDGLITPSSHLNPNKPFYINCTDIFFFWPRKISSKEGVHFLRTLLQNMPNSLRWFFILNISQQAAITWLRQRVFKRVFQEKSRNHWPFLRNKTLTKTVQRVKVLTEEMWIMKMNLHQALFIWRLFFTSFTP